MMRFLPLLFGASCVAHLLVVGALRAEPVGWARLKTPTEFWKRHIDGDSNLTRFIRANTSLDIDPVWYVADVERLDEMCKYPLLFAQSIVVVDSAAGKANLAEYVRRGTMPGSFIVQNQSTRPP